jgi:hypothetical protein
MNGTGVHQSLATERPPLLCLHRYEFIWTIAGFLLSRRVIENKDVRFLLERYYFRFRNGECAEV